MAEDNQDGALKDAIEEVRYVGWRGAWSEKNRKRIDREIWEDLVACGLGEDRATLVLGNMILGSIRNVTVNY